MTKPSKRYRFPAAPVADQRLLAVLKKAGRIDAAAASRIERAMSVGTSAIDAVIESEALS